MSRQFGILTLILAGWLGLASFAQAQFIIRNNPGFQPINPYNPSWRNNPGLSFSQYQAVIRAQARTAATIPPWLYGYNPYPSPIISTGPVIPPYNPYTPLAPGGFPAVTNPYTPIGGAYTNPYTVGGYSNPYTPVGVDPYAGSYGSSYGGYVDPYGGTLHGAADAMRAFGSLQTQNQQAWMIREQVMQARLDTARKKFDLEMYIKANTPTFPEEQAKIAAQTLKRIQTHAGPGEIVSGKSLNILLDDLKKFPGKKAGSDLPPIPDDVLTALNVTTTSGSLGALRDGKMPTWPAALQEIYPPTQLKSIEDPLMAQLKSAEVKGTVDPNVLKDIRKKIDDARNELSRQINDISTGEFLDANKFLNDLDQARLALERGEAKNQFEFMKWAKAAPRTPLDVANYLNGRGLKVAPAAPTDEGSYRALHSALAALDVHLNAQFASTETSKE